MVYLESFAPLVLNKQFLLEDIDDLFGFRFFVAMNNPVLQQNELLKEWQFYKGCFKLYYKWKDYRGSSIPMEHFDLWDKLKAKADKDPDISAFIKSIENER